MNVFSELDMKSQPETVLDRAAADGAVCIRRGDGSEFVLRRMDSQRSPLDVGTVKTAIKLSAEDIVAAVREGRERDYSPRQE
jgi:hypothetical protein